MKVYALVKKGAGYTAAFFFVFLCWQGLAYLVNRPFLPYPLEVLASFDYFFIPGGLYFHFLLSAVRVLASMVLSFVLAVPLGLLLGQAAFLDRIAAPVIYLLHPLPKIVFLPVILVLLGMGNLSKILLISLIIFFQILVTARDASKNLPPSWLLSMKSLHASNWQLHYHLVWPACLPSVFTALRVSTGTAIAVLFIAETFASSDGMGYYILDAMERRSYEAMYSGIITMGLLGLLVYGLLDWLEGIICRWNRL